jgi:hypothetical protein
MLPGSSLADALAQTSYQSAPMLESDALTEDAPDPCIVLEDGYPIGFYDTLLSSGLEMTERGQKGLKGMDLSEPVLAFLNVDAPVKMPLNQPIPVNVALSHGALADVQYAFSLPLAPGAVVDIVVQPRSGLICEEPAMGQLTIPDEGETQPFTFYLRGVEPGTKKYRVLAFHHGRTLGMLELSVLIESASEIEGASSYAQVYPMQRLDARSPGLVQMLMEYLLMGEQTLVKRQDILMGNAILPAVSPALLRVLWQDCKAEQLVNGLVPAQLSFEERMIHQSLLVDELKALLTHLFEGVEVIMVTPLVPGFSGAGVLKVRPFLSGSGGGGSFVVKFGEIRAIAQEYENYQRYVFFYNHSGRYTAAFKHEQTTNLGGILYAFAGTDIRGTRDFGSIYQQWDFPAIKGVLENLFHTACEGWYVNIRGQAPLDLTATYHLPENPSPADLESTLQEHLPLISFEDMLTFKSLSAQPERRFPNPLRAFKATRALWRATHTSTTHGDLNQRNILVDRLGYPWLIDFQSTGPSHILRDIVTLDAVTRFQLLAAEQTTLDEFWQLEAKLYTIDYFDQLADLPESPDTANPALIKMYQTVLYLRRLAGSMLRGSVQEKDMDEYYIALFYLTLETLYYQTLSSEQHERALLSASLLVEKLGLQS